MSLDLSADIRSRRSANSDAYRAAAELRLAAYEGDWYGQVKNYISNHVSTELWQAIGHMLEIPIHENLLKAVVDRTTRTYIKPVRRRLVYHTPKPAGVDENGVETPEVTEDPRLGEILKDTNLDGVNDQALKQSKVAGLSLVHVWVDERKKARFEIHTGDAVELITSYNDPSEIVGARYSTYQSHAQTSNVARVWLWDMEGMAIAVQKGIRVPQNPTRAEREEIRDLYAGMMELPSSGQGIVEERIGFGPDGYPYRTGCGLPVLPFAAFTPGKPPGRAFNIHTGEDLYQAALEVAYAAARLAWIMVLQSHKQFVISGPGITELTKQIMNPAIPTIIPADPGEVQVQVLDLATDPSSITEFMFSVYEKVLLQFGWTRDDFRMTGNRQTAEALTIQNEDRTAYDAHVATDVAGPAEQTLLEALRIVWNAEAPDSPLALDADFVVDFDPNTTIDIIGHIDDVLKAINAGLVNIGDAAAAGNDEIKTQAAGLEVVEQNLKDLAAVHALSASVDTVLAATPPPNAKRDEEVVPDAES